MASPEVEAARKTFVESPTEKTALEYLRSVASLAKDEDYLFSKQEVLDTIHGMLHLPKTDLEKTLNAIVRSVKAERQAEMESKRRKSGRIFKDRDDIQMQVNSYTVTEFSMPDQEWVYHFDVTYTIEYGREMQRVDDNFMIKQANLRKQNIWLDLICRATKSVVGFEDFATTLEGWLKLAPHTKRTEAPRTIETQVTDSILDMIGKMQKTKDWETYKSQPLSYVYFESQSDSYYLANEVIHGLQQIHRTSLPPQTIRIKLQSYMHDGEAKEIRKPQPQQDQKYRAWRFRASAVDEYAAAPPPSQAAKEEGP